MAFAGAIGAGSSLAGVAEQGDLRVRLKTSFAPRQLPKPMPSPVALDFALEVATDNGSPPPLLRTIDLRLDPGFSLAPTGMLPRCRLPGRDVRLSLSEIEEICASAIVGEGSLRAWITFPEQDPIPALAKALAINVSGPGDSASLWAVAEIVQPMSTFIKMPIEFGPANGAFGLRLTLRAPETPKAIGSIDRLRLRFSQLTPGGGEGLVRLRCDSDRVSIGTRASFADGSVLRVDNRQPCGAR